MNCHRALQLMEAAPLAHLSAHDVSVLHAHVETCEACRVEMDRLHAIEAGLRVMRPPLPPREFGAIVAARIARREEVQTQPQREIRGGRVSPRWAAVSTFIGAGIVCLALVLAPLHVSAAASTSLFLNMSILFVDDFFGRQWPLVATGALAVGGLLYAAGLFEPLRDDS